MNPAGITLLVAVLAALPVERAGQTVTIRLAWVEPPPQGVAVTLHARSATESRKSLDIPFDGHDASVPLAAGQWFISASCPGYWSEPALVFVAEQQQPETTLTLYPATRLRANVTIPSPGKAQTVDIYFSPSEATAGQPRGSMTCPMTGGQLDCEVPSGVHDLGFRVPGHASLYRWAVDLRGKASADLGKLAFRIGATLSGRVEVNRGERQESLENIEVTLRNATSGDRNDALRSRQSVTSIVTRPNKRGFFSFDVLPGSYVVSATAKGLASEERQVTVIEGREAALVAPLTLEHLLELTLNIQLPPEGLDQPWKVAVARFDSEGHPASERVMKVPSDGILRLKEQFPGSYTVELRIHDSVWAAQSVFIERNTTLDVSARVMKVRGSIALGDTPLSARLLFLSREKGFRIPAQSRADGTFLVFLPDVAGKPWDEVEIQSTEPWVKRALNDVPVDRDDTGLATMDIRLPEFRIDGVVVDESDRPVNDGLINISAPDGFRQFQMSDGTFTIQGLEPGRHALTASTLLRETQDPLVVDIPVEGKKASALSQVGRL